MPPTKQPSTNSGPTIRKEKITSNPIPISKPLNGVLGRITPIGFDANEGIKIALYGESGTGKTTLWGTFPKPILAMITSGGFRPGELRSLDTPENQGKISQVVIRESVECQEVIANAEGLGFRTLVFDHITGLQDLILKELLGLDELPAQKFWGMASQQIYGTATQQAKEHLRAALNLSINVVIIGQQRTFGGRDDGMDPEIVKPTVGIAAAPSLTSWINPACDYVLQTFKRARMERVPTGVKDDKGKEVYELRRGKGVDYCVRTEAHDVYTTKFRVPRGHKLPDLVVDPSYDKILKIIRGQWDGK